METSEHLHSFTTKMPLQHAEDLVVGRERLVVGEQVPPREEVAVGDEAEPGCELDGRGRGGVNQ